MFIRIRRFPSSAALVLIPLLSFFVLATPANTVAQQSGETFGGNIPYNSGQSIQPIFEGWTKTAEGTYQLWFGYLNRNHAQELSIPVGAENRIEPGAPDRGQPTYFHRRFNRQLFAVTAPADFGEKGQITWTVVANGQTERAVGWLRPDWEIAPPGNGTTTNPGAANNRPPALTISGATQIALADTLTLTAAVTDDGLPPARPARGGGGGARNRPPAFDNPGFKGVPPTNVPDVAPSAPARITARLQVSWFVWRGPAAVVFNPPAGGADEGPAVFTAAFSKPGEYVLRARATDGSATIVKDHTVIVAGQER